MRISGIAKRIPAILGVTGLWFLSSQSTLPQPKGILGWDKLQHLLAWSVLAVSFALWFNVKTWRNRGFFPLAVTFLAASAYGAVDEIHQYFVPGRFSSPWDWLADSTGALLGAAAFMVFAAKTGSGGKGGAKERGA